MRPTCLSCSGLEKEVADRAGGHRALHLRILGCAVHCDLGSAARNGMRSACVGSRAAELATRNPQVRSGVKSIATPRGPGCGVVAAPSVGYLKAGMWHRSGTREGGWMDP